MSRRFSFDLYRLNIEDIDDLFALSNYRRLRGDNAIRGVLEAATASERDQMQITRTALFKWSLRNYLNLEEICGGRQIIHLVLARSLLEKRGEIVTDEGLDYGTSSATPPLASTAVCLFDLSRHLVAIEHTGELSQTAWKDYIEKILASTTSQMEVWSTIQLEPIPEQNGILGLFRSFDRVTRMKVTLRIPNPELNRYTLDLYKDLSKSGVREITQDMKNPNGMSKAEDARPYASAALAEQGYKKGEVYFEGVREDKFEQASSGSTAARGRVKGLRDFVRGLKANAKTKEAAKALSAIVQEIDRLHPAPENE